jgi:hypothetical protein
VINHEKLARLRYRHDIDLDAVRSLSDRQMQALNDSRLHLKNGLQGTPLVNSSLTAAELLANPDGLGLKPADIKALRASFASMLQYQHIKAEWDKATAARNAEGPFWTNLFNYVARVEA